MLTRRRKRTSIAGKQTICLCMIVKNEAPVIQRCLASVRPIIDQYLVVDTGSTDETRELVHQALDGVPGTLVDRPWVDFGTNRSEALALARPRAAYCLIIDADDELLLPTGFRMPPLDADSYEMEIEDVGITYRRTQLVSNNVAWRYGGVLHEFLTCPEAKTVGQLPIRMRRGHDGRRRRDPSTYRNDAAVLERALESETDPFLVSRYTFYLGQSHRDAGAPEPAIDAYLRRATLGYWDQEIFVALLQAARLMESAGRDADTVLATYQRASDTCSTRAEAAHGASRFCRFKGLHDRGYAIARRALGLQAPPDGLFVEGWIYDYGLRDELAVHASWTGDHEVSRDACKALLESDKLPPGERERIAGNLRFAEDRIAERQAAAAEWQPSRAQGGTEIMVEALRERLGDELEAIDLRINSYDPASRDARALVVWFHHDVDQAAVQWCRDKALTAQVSSFIFVSHWQRERYIASFALAPERCIVIRHALEQTSDLRRWERAPLVRCAYTSTPFRGLDVLLDAWEQLEPEAAELHVWSSMKLYAADDTPYRHLFDRARAIPGVVYHGLAPNAELRAALRTMHFLTYPSTFAETACLSVIEAMAAGCRVILPSYGALPETASGYARVYPWSADPREHSAIFAGALAEEIAKPWRGRPDTAIVQQAHCATVFAWSRCLDEWRAVIHREVTADGRSGR